MIRERSPHFSNVAKNSLVASWPFSSIFPLTSYWGHKFSFPQTPLIDLMFYPLLLYFPHCLGLPTILLMQHQAKISLNSPTSSLRTPLPLIEHFIVPHCFAYFGKERQNFLQPIPKFSHFGWRAPKSLLSPKLGLSYSSCGIVEDSGHASSS
jgi:hypothetical protein